MSTPALVARAQDGGWQGVPVRSDGEPAALGSYLVRRIQRDGLERVVAEVVEHQPLGWMSLPQRSRADAPAAIYRETSDLGDFLWLYVLEVPQGRLRVVDLHRGVELEPFSVGGDPLPTWYEAPVRGDVSLPPVPEAPPASVVSCLTAHARELGCDEADLVRVVREAVARALSPPDAAGVYVFPDGTGASSPRVVTVGGCALVCPDVAAVDRHGALFAYAADESTVTFFLSNLRAWDTARYPAARIAELCSAALSDEQHAVVVGTGATGRPYLRTVSRRVDSSDDEVDLRVRARLRPGDVPEERAARSQASRWMYALIWWFG